MLLALYFRGMSVGRYHFRKAFYDGIFQRSPTKVNKTAAIPIDYSPVSSFSFWVVDEADKQQWPTNVILWFPSTLFISHMTNVEIDL
jgi:hypothetical protein